MTKGSVLKYATGGTMLKKITAVTLEKTRANEISITLLRLFIGLSFVLTHGYDKVFGGVNAQLTQGLVAMNFPAPEFFGWCASLSEFVGGLLIALGLFT